MKLVLAIDFGSTFTKANVLDLSREELVARAQAPSTVGTDVTIGLLAALNEIERRDGMRIPDFAQTVACSSAAGGLRIVAIGLVEALTTKAAREAALGSGGKVVGVYSNGLTEDNVADVAKRRPDIILLAGGTDGGDSEVILNNAQLLAKSQLDVPYVVAGNKMASATARQLLDGAGKTCYVTDNVLPRLDQLNIDPVRHLIRQIFMQRIIYAKGISKAMAVIGVTNIIPTPLAVFRGFSLLAKGTKEEAGLGDLLGVGVGGATIDICSMASGAPSQPGVSMKGIPEPYAKRSVEGDLGIRYNCKSLLDMAGTGSLRDAIRNLDDKACSDLDIEGRIEYMSSHVDSIPVKREDVLLDTALARAGVDIAVQRHAGTVTEVATPMGIMLTQYGKDLTSAKAVVGTGGIFAYGQRPCDILEAACFCGNNRGSLRPIQPDMYVDKDYVLYAVGTLSEMFPDKALRIMKKSLLKL